MIKWVTVYTSKGVLIPAKIQVKLKSENVYKCVSGPYRRWLMHENELFDTKEEVITLLLERKLHDINLKVGTKDEEDGK